MPFYDAAIKVAANDTNKNDGWTIYICMNIKSRKICMASLLTAPKKATKRFCASAVHIGTLVFC